MKLKFLLDYTDSPLWSNDAVTESTFGYNITDLAGLGLHPDTINQIHLMMQLFGERLNPVYQGYPSFWSGRMFELFQMFANKVYQQILDELDESVEVDNREKAFLTEPIEVEKIDMELQMFLSNPAKFSDENGVVYGSKEVLKLDVDVAYGVWVEKEISWVFSKILYISVTNNQTFNQNKPFCMKNHLPFLFFLVMLLAQTPAFAQPKHSFAFRHVWYNYITPQDDNFDFGKDFGNIYSDSKGSGLEIAYQNRLFTNGFLVIPIKVGVTQTTAGDDAPRQFIGNLDALFQYSLFKHGSLINIPLHAGIGSTWFGEDEEFDFNIPLGLGINVRLLPNLYLNGQTQYRLSFNDRNAWHHGFGLTFFFGQTITPPVPDRDGDGISDIDDKCPDQPGVAALMGCPDRDGDGLADRDDICPDQPGLAALNGCPDRDGDGVVDSADACPDVAGSKSFYGCPDTDNDGIEDRDDRCPTEVGPISNLGCPIKDRDKDGVPDADDRCPDNAGTAGNRGCPDRDGDGVVDIDDRCPDKAGPASNRGCPEIKAEDKAVLELAVKDVQFNTGKATLVASSLGVLDQVAKLMTDYPDYSLDIKGHTDSQGDAGVNLNLSKKRAQACYDYLVKKGVPASRMTHEGFGETKPVADNINADGRAKNRRVEFDMHLK